MLGYLLNAVATGGTTSTLFDWSTIDLSPITSGITSALPVIIPVSLGIMAVPIVFGFIRSMVKKSK